MRQRPLARRRFALSLLGAAASVGTAGWWLGRSAGENQRRKWHRVTGGSMCPTLWGEHFQVECPQCRVRFRIDASPTGSLVHAPRPTLLCWHCGAPYARPRTAPRAGDLVAVEPVADVTAYRVGDLVAVTVENELRIKRLLGLPGDRMSLSENPHTPAQLLRNGEPVATAVSLPVDRDRLRDESRWRPRRLEGRASPAGSDAATNAVADRATDPPVDPESTRWKRRERSWQAALAPSHSATLVYTHRSVHDLDAPSVVLDDWPANPLLSRRLMPAAELSLSLQLTCSSPLQLVVAFATRGVIDRVVRDLEAGQHGLRLTSRDTGESREVGAAANSVSSVAPEQPIAITVQSDVAAEVRLEHLAVDRPLDYRLRPRDDASIYPFHLNRGEYYVVGDNVPISIDSRQLGPIDQTQLVGRVVC